MNIEKFLPSPALMPLIKEFMIIESDVETGSKTIPDTSMTMSFRYCGSVLKGESAETISAATVSGLRKSVRLFHYTKATSNLLVIFKEGGFTAFSKIPAHELFNISIGTENLFHSTELAEILQRLAEAKNNFERIFIIESFFLKKLATTKRDLSVNHAINLIKQQNGIIRIKDLARHLHISQDPFEKKFRQQVGSSPKQYASIIRLRNLIKNYSSYSSLTDASYEAGYFDQSHFIKDFRLFTGQAPKDFFKSSQYW